MMLHEDAYEVVQQFGWRVGSVYDMIVERNQDELYLIYFKRVGSGRIRWLT